MVGTTCGFVSRTLSLIVTPFILVVSIIATAGCWMDLVKNGSGLSTAQKVVDGVLGFITSVYCIIILFGFFALCMGNIRFTKLYKNAMLGYLISYGIMGLINIIIVATHKSDIIDNSECTDDCDKVFTVVMIISCVVWLIGMGSVGLLVFLLRSSIVTMEGGMNSSSKASKHGYSSQSYAPLMDPTHESGYSAPYNPPQQSYRDSHYTHQSQMSHSSTPSMSGNTSYPPPQGSYNHA